MLILIHVTMQGLRGGAELFWRQADKLLKAGIECAGTCQTDAHSDFHEQGRTLKELDFAGFNPERGQVLPERYAGYSFEYSGEMEGTISH